MTNSGASIEGGHPPPPLGAIPDYGPKSLQTVAASSCEIRSHDNKIPLATENELLYCKIFNFVTDHEWPPAARYF